MLRPIKKDDYQAIHQMIGQEWHQDLYQVDKTLADAYVNFDVNACLQASTFGRVAEIDGQVLGVVMGRDLSQNPTLGSLAKDLNKSLAILLQAPDEVRKELTDFYHLEKGTYKQLVDDSPYDYDGEVTLFILSPEARGKGLGSKLFDAVVNYLDSQNCQNFYLYSDDACNFGFYDHRGLCQRQAIDVKPGQDQGFKYYLYDRVNE